MMERAQMAGEWIKFESVTPDKPEVYQLAEILGIDPDSVVGKLVRVWVWADQQTIDGNARGVTRALLDRLTSAGGFADALIAVGWLLEVEGGLTFPRFDEHNGKTAKARALGAKRASKSRASRSERDASATTASPREEKRREENNQPSPPARTVVVEGIGPSIHATPRFTVTGGMVIQTEPAAGGGGVLSSGKTDEPPASWESLTRALTAAGLNMAAEAARAARTNGATPENCLAALEHWRANPGAWSIGIIWTRFKDPRLSTSPAAVGWPTPAARVIVTNGENDARERQAEQFADIDESKKKAAESNAALDELAELHGGAIDQLGGADLEALLPAGPARVALARHGWRAAIVRGRVLRAYVETYLGEPVTS
tara:strand:- start:5068 stop:6183 length:1116 start_codon:yes stop_codon:yes gene_type:complete